MAQYSLEQSETIRVLAYSDTSEKLLSYRYHRYCGLFRYAFASVARLAHFDQRITESISVVKQEELEEQIFRTHTDTKTIF